MTTSQALRKERRRQRLIEEQRARQELVEAIIGIVLVLMLVAAFAYVGTTDYQDEQREAAYWAERGVTISRGW